MISRLARVGWLALVVAGGCTTIIGLDGEFVLSRDGEGGSGGADVTSSTGSASSAGGAGGAGGVGGQSASCNQGACSPKDPQCSLVPSCCIALADNKGQPTAGLRMSQITITKPTVLAPNSIVGNLVAHGVQMNLEKCNLAGGGTFSWLLHFDPGTGKLLTGGARPTEDPFGGYCFVSEILGGKQIVPVSVDSGLSAGAFSADVGDIIVPIFLDAAATSYLLMPLTAGKLTGTLSEDSNCVGAYNAENLDPVNSCLAEPPDTLQFVNAGTLDGFIKLENADTVIIDGLSMSLCVLLSGNAAMYGDGMSPNKCKRDMNGKIVFQGDWCEATNAAADAMCSDSVKLGAEFAASAVQINGTCPAACYAGKCAEYLTDNPPEDFCADNPSKDIYDALADCICDVDGNPATGGKCAMACANEECAGKEIVAGGACQMCIADTAAGCGNEFNVCANDF
jgi:hypothetical protein